MRLLTYLKDNNMPLFQSQVLKVVLIIIYVQTLIQTVLDQDIQWNTGAAVKFHQSSLYIVDFFTNLSL